ncbi:4637_t:CDS:2 [Gigaspora rosea]|nr:4637_t:CDS:2 [Gigaspora rosea]
MSYYKNTKKVEKMFARLTTGGSNPAMAGETKEIKETVERALLPIELSDRVSPTLDVPIAPMIASYRYASGFGYREEIDSRLRTVEDKLLATLDVSELQLFVEQELKEAVEDYLEDNNYDFLQGFRNRKTFTIFKSSNSEDMQDQPTGTPEDTEDQVAVSKTTSVQEISNTPEKCSGPESSEVQQET